jgi:pyruvate dehydrogenase E2 component (dihydrolipoamide acetyltransferase)
VLWQEENQMSEAEPLTRMRRAIVKVMSASALVPQFSIEMTLDVANLAAIRERLSVERRPSYTDALVASTARALRDHPWVNVSYVGDGIVRHDEINVAIAVAIEDGLISPVITRANTRSIEELSAERVRLTASALAGSLTPQEVLSATFTISNMGPLGVRRFTALVVPPQAAILAVGAVEQGTIALTLTVDHRPLDGAPAARFLAQIRSQLEDRSWLEQLFGDLLDRQA